MWINDGIFGFYFELRCDGYVYLVEVWQGDELVGGFYGVLLGCVFFGESMFSCVIDVLKIVLVYLVVWLKVGGYMLLDIQFIIEYLEMFGVIIIICM